MKLRSIVYSILVICSAILIFFTNLYIDDIEWIEVLLYLVFILASLITTLILFPKSKSKIPFYLISVIILYTSFHLSIGMHFLNEKPVYYYSFPRNEMLPPAYGILIFWYLLAYALDAIFNKRYSKWIFPIFDVLTIPLVLIGLLFSTFVSPA